MNSTISEIKAQANDLKLECFDEEYEGWEGAYPINLWLTGKGSLHPLSKAFEDWLKLTFDYKFIKTNSDDLPDYDEWRQGHMEEGYTVIQLDGVYYKLTYEVESYGGIECEDYWDWKEATPVKKEFTFFE